MNNNYYSFGMMMPGRSLSLSDYRFGFNTQEKVDEISGNGNHNTALFWEYDTRLGRRWNLDPVLKESHSPYVCFNNNPILNSDPSGDETVENKGPVKEFSVPMENAPDPDPPKYDVKNLKFSNEGLEFTKKQEGLVKHVYNDAKGTNSKYYEENDHTVIASDGKVVTGKPTIGYGHLVTAEEDNSCKYENGINEKQAEVLLSNDVAEAVKAVKSATKVPLTQYQFDAMVDFTFNVGGGSAKSGKGLKGSEFLRELNKANYDGQLMDHFRSPKAVVKRRDDQIHLFNTGHYVFRIYNYNKKGNRKN